MTTGIFATLLRPPPNFTTRVLGAVKPSLSEDDDDEEEEYDDDDDIDVTAACLAAVYILWCGFVLDFCLSLFFLFLRNPPKKQNRGRGEFKKKERRESISLLHSYSSMYIIDNT